jgi:hypothetical protein
LIEPTADERALTQGMPPHVANSFIDIRRRSDEQRFPRIFMDAFTGAISSAL